jgi:hypothetical protein
VVVFPLVMSSQSLTHQGDVVGDERGSGAVSGRDGQDQARHQPELAAEHPVHHEHVTSISVGFAIRHRSS